MTAFTDLELDPRVLKAVTEAGYETPTPIQAQAIPEALTGRDVLGIAQTGTGKTASFTLPMLSLLAKGRARARMPRSLVLAPTRELAAQVAENFETYSKHMKLTMALLIGGTSFKDQDRLIDRGVDVLIATPGRLLDHFERGKLMLTGIEIMVVDEADRMLDMGFIPDIERIFKLTPFTRQTLFFSATMAPEITRITQEFLSNPVRVEVARQATAAETIEQAVCKITPSRRDRADKEKRDALRALIDAEGEKLTNGIIFCNRKRDVDIVAKSLAKHGYDAAPIHGDLDQSIRTRTLESFRDGGLRLLVASDVAARGLDIPSVSHVFNFDIPIHSEDYVHRIGRTGRAGRSGKALSLYVPADEKHLDKVEELLGKKIPVVENPLGDAAPATSDEGQDEERRSSRSRSRSRSRKRDDAPAAEADSQAQAAPEPRESRSRDARPADTRSGSNDSRARGGRSRSRGRDDNRVVGMGDHVPAFMTRDLRAALADLEKDEPEETAEEPVVEAETETPVEAVEEKPKKAKRKRTSKKKDVEPKAEAADAEGEAVSEAVEAPAEAPAVEAEAAPADAPAAEAESTEVTAPEPDFEPVAEEKPKKPRKRRTSKKAAEEAPAETTTEMPAEAASAPAPQTTEPQAEEAKPEGVQPEPASEDPKAEAQAELAPETQAEPASEAQAEEPAKQPTRQRKPRARASASSVINTVKGRSRA
ncbi:DEAD/DEAH box helicase [Halovulum sp. GXIMD14794]